MRRVREPVLAPWRRPAKVELVDGWVQWDPAGPTVEARPGEGLVDAFVALASVPPQDLGEHVLAFASNWGPLAYCHFPSCPGHPFLRFGQPPPNGSEGRGTVSREPLEEWAIETGQIAAATRLIASLNSGLAGQRSDWEVLRKGVPPRDVEAQQGLLSFGLNIWLASTHASLAIGMTREGPTLQVNATGLMAAIILRSVLRSIGGSRVAICVGCGQAWEPGAKLRVDPPKCPSCRGLARQQAFRKARSS